jgi:hypothetical protein
MRRRVLLPLALLAVAPALAQQAPAPPAPAKPEPAAPATTVAILGEPVVGPDGKAVGRLIDVMVDASGAPQAAAIDFGGFIGIGSRKIVVPWSALHFAPQASKSPITLEMTPAQIKVAPDYKPANPPPVPPPAPGPASAPAPLAVPAPAPAPTPPAPSP